MFVACAAQEFLLCHTTSALDFWSSSCSVDGLLSHLSACLLSLKEEEGELQSNSCSIYACSDPQSHPRASREGTLCSAAPTLACSALRLPGWGNITKFACLSL